MSDHPVYVPQYDIDVLTPVETRNASFSGPRHTGACCLSPS